MGEKTSARRVAVEAGVPVVPGALHPLAENEAIVKESRRIGFPLMLKPSRGGGGKGMRVARGEGGFLEALASSRREARAAFGDDAMVLERFVERPRHVEVQVMADGAGRIVPLGERECSVQRRYQTIIEESPSFAVDDELRRRMGDCACRLAREAGYANAGTVELLLDPQGEFYFLEMNTRLQVEHPVTEMVTGLDLVEWQLRVAAGQPLPKAPESSSQDPFDMPFTEEHNPENQVEHLPQEHVVANCISYDILDRIVFHGNAISCIMTGKSIREESWPDREPQRESPIVSLYRT